MSRRVAKKTAGFTESVIREMSRICAQESGINLAQGFPDFPAPEAMKEAAVRAIRADVNQYAVTWGAPDLRQAIAKRSTEYNRIPTDADANVTVCCGATEAMISTLMAIVDEGDEVIIFEPFYENYGPDCTLSGATPRFVSLHAPDWSFDRDELRAAFGERTRAIVINTPHNPTGKVFDRAELEFIAQLCIEFDVIAITDEIYEYILYDGQAHISIASLPDMLDRTVTISGLSKTWSATGWRVGWCLAPADISNAIRKVHDFLTVGAPAPLQAAAAEALAFEQGYFDGLIRDYTRRRDILVSALNDSGFTVYKPAGAYYIMTDIRGLTDQNDVEFAMNLLKAGGVATVPGSSFFHNPADGSSIVRFCFAKRIETLEQAALVLRERLG
ncbi:MAG: aspartate/methionine/tyrosine aminotransferase [Planctomycetota bacterium]|jgi:aspartate/methionine/tyrosine aminotransferase